MDFGGRGGYQSRNVIEIIPVVDPWPPPPPPVRNDEPIWATEDDYGEQSPGKKSQSEPPGNGPASKSNSIGKMFFKTKLCCKFRLGTCPYVTNCNFAHGMEELRDPPPNWQNIMAAAHEDRPEPREEQRIPILTSSTLIGEGQRFFKGRHCKKFYTEGGCPYGENCAYLHDDQSKARENMAISVNNSGGGGGYGGGNSSGPSPKLSNWKTRMCNKWEMTGFCPFGSKCHFAHGAAELHRYGGGLVEVDGRDASSAAPDSNQAGPLARAPMNTFLVSNVSVSNTDAYATYHVGVPAQRSAVVAQRQGQRTPQKWKGPDKISRIYGDWIDEFD